MQYQIDTRRRRPPEIRVGRDEREVAVFRMAGRFVHNLQGTADGVEVQLKLPAPWTGFRYRLHRGEHELASAKRVQRMHAFEPDRPYTRHRLVEFELDVLGESFRLTPQDRRGLSYVLYREDQPCGGLVMRTFEAQREGAWEGDLEVPEGWSVALAGFLAWLSQEGRPRMSS